MKGRSGRGVTGPLAVAISSAVITSSPTLIPAAPTTANQQADQNSVENGRSESATTAQISTQVISGGAQPSTPRTPTSPPEHGANTPNPPTPGNTSSNNSTLVDTSPQYVTITADGPGNRSYASLTPVNTAVVDGETVTGETVGENAAYVTYVEGSDTLYAAAAAAAAAASANGQTMTYPVYTVGDSTATAIYSPGGSTTQYYTTSTSTPTVAYTQESGVTYLVPSTNNNNSISLEAADGQHNISHATRVSPATQTVMKSQRKRCLTSTPQKTPIQHINYPPAKIRRIESFNSQNSTKLLHSFSTPIPPPVVVTLESSSGESDLEDSEEDRNSNTSPALLLGTDLRLNHFDRKIKRMIATAGSGPCLDKFKISDNSNGASNLVKRNEILSPSFYGHSYPKSKDLDIIPIANFLNSETKSNTAEIPGGNGNYFTSGEGNLSGSSVAKFCPITVQWLLENYETAEGVSLPRSTLYYHYLRHCNDHKLDPVNAASFGKLIRSVFLGLRTRRLGTRGNSKYHYYGIRLKPNSPLVNVTENGEISLSQSQSNSPSQNGSASGSQGETTVVEGGGRSCTIVSNGTGNGAAKRLKTSKGEHYEVGHNVTGNLADPYTIQQFLGDPSGALDNLPDLDMKINIPEDITVDDLLIFRTLYREHCESLLDCLSSFQLSQVESYWRNFWRNSLHSDTIEVEYEKMMPKNKLVMLCMVKEVQNFIRETDFQFYQNVVGILLPDVLRPIPSSMTQAIRNFAKTLESWLSGAMTGYPEEVVAMKLAGVNALAQTLRRYTSLNHLAQAARAVLQNQNQIAQMLSDLNRVDFHNVEEQASWVCGCDGDMVPSLEQDFKATLAQQQTLEQWATWLEGVVDRILRPHLTSPRFVQAARHFLLKWSFYSSLVIRDLTLRSAASFGSFHLLRLLYDEYMFYLVEHRVAQVTGIVPIAVIGKKIAGENAVEPSSQSPSFIRTGSTDEEASTVTTLTVEYVDSKPQIALLTRRQSSLELATVVNGNSMNGTENSSSAPPSPIVASDITPPASSSTTIVTSTANVNVHQINATHGGVTKTEMKRVKNFLAA